MPNESNMRTALDEIAQALSVIAPLSTVLRQTLTAQADEAVMLEAAVERAVRAMRRLQPVNGRDAYVLTRWLREGRH
jgi:hypothetical protein